MPQAAPGFGGVASLSERRLLLAASRLCSLPGGPQCLSVGYRLGARCITFPTGLVKLMPQAAPGFGGGAGFSERRLLLAASRLCGRLPGGPQCLSVGYRLGTRCITFPTGLVKLMPQAAPGFGGVASLSERRLLLAASRLCGLPGGPQCLSVGYRLGARCITFPTGLVNLMPQAAPGFGGVAGFSERRLLLAASRLCGRLPGGLQCLSVGYRLGTRCITFPTGLVKLMPQAAPAGFGGGAGFSERRLLLAASRLCGLPGGPQCLSVGDRLGARCITFPAGLVKLMPQAAPAGFGGGAGFSECRLLLAASRLCRLPGGLPPRRALHHVPGGPPRAPFPGGCEPT